MDATPAGLLFTAFERSGDEHAAPVIARLRSLHPELPIYALGGMRMQAAGATLLDLSPQHGTMLLDALGQVQTHLKRLSNLKKWLTEHRIRALIPVDSPAANWSICSLVRKTQPQAKIIHLVAPQLWAWAPWRVRKMRRLSDHALCLLPFEPAWFAQHGIQATFVGHPVFDAENEQRRIDAAHATTLPQAPMKLALLPGSRISEIKSNWPTMLAVLRELEKHHGTGNVCAAVGAADAHIADMIRTSLIPVPNESTPSSSLIVKVDATDEVLDWADVALLTSGTVSLHAAAHRKPMVILYNLNRLTWMLVGQFLMQTKTFTLPNLISEGQGLGRVVREFVPHFGEVPPLLEAVQTLLTDPAARVQQQTGITRIMQVFEGMSFADQAAGKIMELIGRP
ncbi:MAG: hypothetical protein HC898_11720 [Phycisphaerales bacterium]|nr:hypothetical protein [Phycisphaerales bacterium]